MILSMNYCLLQASPQEQPPTRILSWQEDSLSHHKALCKPMRLWQHILSDVLSVRQPPIGESLALADLLAEEIGIKFLKTLINDS